MKPPPFFVVADRGHMKAYHFKESMGRAPAAMLVEQADVAEACLKYEERFTDQAGAFPSGSAPGVANAVAERLSLEEETKARICKHLGGQLTEWLNRHKPHLWGFAAPSEINNAILHNLARDYHKNLIRNLKQDLVHVPASDLLQCLNRKISSP